jgi:CubicO group peptidase (beta-lactamase class C family)
MSTGLQAQLNAAVTELAAAGTETGLQVAVMKDGELVADAVAGAADSRTGAEAGPDTLFFAASTAKGVASTVAHVLVERGELDYELRAAEVWPEFGSHGKDRVTRRHVLRHTAGVPGLPPDTTVADMCDWEHMCAVIAAAQPWWEPGTRFGYHARTFGFLLGEIARRATGRTISEQLRALVTGPLGIEDEVHFGVPRRLLPQVGQQDAGEPAPAPPEPGSPVERAIPRGVTMDAGFANRADVLTSDIPSQGTMSARGVARMYSALLGHVNGVSLVSAKRLTAMAAAAFTGMDEVMGFPSQWAFGYSPGRPSGLASRPGSAFGMVGMDGSTAYADIDSGVAFAVMRNCFADDFTAVTRVDQIVAEAFAGRTR